MVVGSDEDKANYLGNILGQKSLFLASVNQSTPELSFPSTPVPLLGFHG